MSDLYVVRRRRCCWERPRDIGPPLVAAFRDRAAAEAKADELSRWHGRTHRPKGYPFFVDWVTPEDADGHPSNDLARVTSLPAYALRDWLLEAGFPDDPPNPMPAPGNDDLNDWQLWWELVLDGGGRVDARGNDLGRVPPRDVTDGQLTRFWEAMDRFPFYDVAGVGWHPAATEGVR